MSVSDEDEEEALLRSVALQNAHSIQLARIRAERELLATQEALRESSARLSNILESITDGLAVLDNEWRITYMNPRAESLVRPLQKNPKELIGQVLWQAFPDLVGTSLEENYRKAASEQVTIEFEFFYPPLDGWFEIRVFPHKDGLSVYFQDISVRKRAEESLRMNEEFLRATFEQAAVGIAVADMNGTFQEMNDKFCAILGYSRAELRSMTFHEITHPDDQAHTKRMVQRLVNGEIKDYVLEKRYLRKDGELVWSLTSVTLLRDEQGQPLRFIGAIEDITQRKVAEAERIRLSSVIEKSLNEIYIFDPDTLRFQYVNLGALRNLGYSLKAMRNMTPLDIKPKYSEAEFRRMTGPLLRGQQEKIVFYTLHRRCDGSDYPVEVHLQVVEHDGQRMFAAVVLDITERKRAEQALRRSEAELRTLADSIPQLAWMAEPDGHIFWYNQRWYEYTGTCLEQMQGWGWQTVHDPKMLPQVLERWKYTLDSGEPFEMEFPLRGADGQFRWFLTRVNPLRDADGRVLRWFGTNTDVDQVKQIREMLEDETRILELLNRTGTILSSNLDLQTLVQSVTDAATQLSGAAFGAFFYNVINDQGESFLLYSLSGAPREAFEQFGLPRNTEIFNPTFRGESVLRSADITQDPRYGKLSPHYGMPPGHLPVCSYLAVPVVSRSGDVIGGLFFGHPERDVFTERHERIMVGLAAQAAIAIDNARLFEAAQKAARERKILLENERAAREEAERTSELKDEFLANLSHELRTPLNAILGWTQVLRMRAQQDTDLRQGLETIERNARVQTQLIEDLLDMNRITSGKLRLDIQPVDPASVIEAAIETVQPAADAKGIRLDKLLDPTAGPISGDPGRLQQVVWNLLSNALKFTPKGGRVQILLERVNSHIEISVADTGIGISADFVVHVFERFRQADASTTRKHSGLGLGLSIVKSLVELHGGSVTVKSAGEGCGATFTVQLPLTAVYRDVDPSERLHPKARTLANIELKPANLRGVKILVVDDERDARELLKRVLEDCGAEIIMAASAEEALDIAQHAQLDLLISDIGMPDMDGYELLKQLRAMTPSREKRIPAIALTAFARSEDRTRALRAGFAMHISKPVEPAELVTTVASIAGRIEDI